jgi:hypothetical protein
MKKKITESLQIHKKWYEEAAKQTPETVGDFVKGLMEDYEHDYGTICHAISAGAIAQAWAMNSHPQGGITGFQAGCVMWGFIREWTYQTNKTGLKILDFDKLLYPQYEDHFDKTITRGVWEKLQEQAKIKIDKANDDYLRYIADKIKYELDLEAFIKKYPDYLQNKEHYDRLSFGNGDQWEAEEKRKNAGFEFAPQKPYEPINSTSRVYMHWQSILEGVVPFGYLVIED